MTTLVPAYGRDYKSQAAVKADWEAGKDFVIADVFSGEDGRYVTKSELPPKSVHMIRYAGLRKICKVVALVLVCAMLSGCTVTHQLSMSYSQPGVDVSYVIVGQ